MNNSDRILKKTVFGGFRRSEVLDYVEKLQSENVSLADELRQKSVDSSKLDELMSDNDRQASEISNMKVLLENAEEKNLALEEQVNSLLSEVESLKAENASLKNDKSNSLIQDALKYSDSLVESAKESAGRALLRAGDSINAASLDVKSAGERVRTAQVNLDYSLSAVKTSVDKLIDELEAAAGSLHSGE